MAELLAPDSLRAALFKGAQLCERMIAIDCEEDYVTQQRADLESERSCPEDDPDVAAVTARRDALWNDALREAAISNDRLYAFVRQLTGTISEPVDAVAVVDDSALVEAHRRAQDARGARRSARPPRSCRWCAAC